MAGPNIFRAAWAAVWALRVRRPRSLGDGRLTHEGLRPTLEALGRQGGLDNVDAADLTQYVDGLVRVDPAGLSIDHGLAYWINLYNALAVQLAIEARDNGHDSVLEIRAGFERRVLTVAGERLSLSDIEHGKIRRYRDPRIHAALVCGSLSCPTLRSEPFDGDRVHHQLDDQLTFFASAGAVAIDRPGERVALSRVFLWYGSDFAKPRRMPTFLPVRRRAVAAAVLRFIDRQDLAWFEAVHPDVEFQAYDWGLGCKVV